MRLCGKNNQQQAKTTAWNDRYLDYEKIELISLRTIFILFIYRCEMKKKKTRTNQRKEMGCVRNTNKNKFNL